MTRPARTGQPQPLAPSRPRQRPLDRAAKRRRQRRFPALDDRLCRPAILGRAWREVRAHGGRAGVDGVRRADVEPQGVAACRQALAPALGAGSSRPQPVLRGSLPQPDGRQRPLGMPTVRERVGPQAGTSVLAPLFEAHVQHPASGFRPRRRATPAVQVVQAPRGSPGSVGDGDRAGVLDTIDQERLRRCVARRISARRVVTRRRQGWPAGGVDEGPWCPTPSGSPQGGVLSPLWANIDVHVLARYGAPPYSWRGPLTRYADDMVLVSHTRSEAAPALPAVTPSWQQRHLTGPPTPPGIVAVQRAGCEWLGCHVHTGRARTSGQRIPRMWPGQTARQAIRSHLREQTERRGVRGPIAAMVATLHLIMRGWRTDVRVGHSTTKVQDLDR